MLGLCIWFLLVISLQIFRTLIFNFISLVTTFINFHFFPARQLIEYQYGNGIDVVLGGGWRSFLPCGSKDPEGNLLTGNTCRNDNRNLTDEWLKNYNNSAVVWNKDELKKIDPDKVDHLLGTISGGSIDCR